MKPTAKTPQPSQPFEPVTEPALSRDLLRSVVDTLTDHLVVINAHGEILFANASWERFGMANGCTIRRWSGNNYLNACDIAAAHDDEFGRLAGEGIRQTIDGVRPEFQLEYPCDSPDERRWFLLRVSPVRYDDQTHFALSHKNITARKQAQAQVAGLSRVDPITTIANRMRFDEFLENEWRRCARARLPISLALVNLDYFQCLQDTHGHPGGDACLRATAALVAALANRPGDLAARYGGETLALILGNTPREDAYNIVTRLRRSIRRLPVRNERAPSGPHVTASIGLATVTPRRGSPPTELLEAAQALLYRANSGGRDRIECQSN